MMVHGSCSGGYSSSSGGIVEVGVDKGLRLLGDLGLEGLIVWLRIVLDWASRHSASRGWRIRGHRMPACAISESKAEKLRNG